MENINRSTTCAFTGHRPQKLNISENEAKALLCRAIENAIGMGYDCFITGMASGVDVWAGELLCEFKNIYPDLKIICVLPYPTFCQSRLKECRRIMDYAYLIHTVCPFYTPYSYQQRNMWMVDHSSLLIALFNGSEGGTYNTINYAKKEDVRIISLIK